MTLRSIELARIIGLVRSLGLVRIVGFFSDLVEPIERAVGLFPTSLPAVIAPVALRPVCMLLRIDLGALRPFVPIGLRVPVSFTDLRLSGWRGG